jgi:hypothetical protein
VLEQRPSRRPREGERSEGDRESPVGRDESRDRCEQHVAGDRRPAHRGSVQAPEAVTARAPTTNEVDEHRGAEGRQERQRDERTDVRPGAHDHGQRNAELGDDDQPDHRGKNCGRRAELGGHLADAVAVGELRQAGDGEDGGQHELAQQQCHALSPEVVCPQGT